MTATTSTMLEAALAGALECAALGLRVHPVYALKGTACACWKGASCITPGKHPIGSGWQKTSSADPTEILQMAAQYPGCNFGVQAGALSRVAVLDVDPRNNGDDSLYEIERELGPFPDTRRVKTGGNGEHIYLKHPGGVLLSCGIAAGVELKADNANTDEDGKRYGANIVAPGSLHKSGNRYAWELSTIDYRFADIPLAWLARFRECAAQERKASKGPLEERYAPGARYPVVLSLAGWGLSRGLTEDEIFPLIWQVNLARFEVQSTEDAIRRIVGDVYKRYQAGELVSPKLVTAGQTWSFAKLMATDFPPPSFVVDKLIADEGLTILGGKKKAGKSWLALQIAMAVPLGRPLLGMETKTGRVLYYCLEDGLARIKARLQKMGLSAADDLQIDFRPTCLPLDNGGIEALESELLGTLDDPYRLIVIDTLTAARTGKVKENESGIMSDIVNDLRRIAQRFKVAILVVHHHGKAISGDIGDDLRGTSAIGGAADLMLGLYRGDSGFTLKAEGRDIEPLELRIYLDTQETWTWRLVGDARQLAKSEAEAETLAAVETLGEADAAAVARELGKQRQPVSLVLKRLAREGKVKQQAVKTKHGNHVMYSASGEKQCSPSATTTTHASSAPHAPVDILTAIGA